MPQSAAQIFDAMRASPMNDWVGGADPEAVGKACASIVTRMTTIGPDAKVLDFGCGIGRVMASLLETTAPQVDFTGFDIMSPVIEFCDANIAPAFPNASFVLVDDSNDHYDQFRSKKSGLTPANLREQFGSTFSNAYAFSVFTHIDHADFQNLLGLVGSVLQPGGQFLFTAFALTEFSREMIAQNQSRFPLEERILERDGDILIGKPDDRLAFIAYDRGLLERMAWDAGLVITKIEYGTWMGGTLGSSLQDLIVCRRPFGLLERSEVQQVKTVPREPRAAAG